MIASRRFIVRCHGDDIVVENARTGEQVRVEELAAIGEQIESWLKDGGGGLAGDAAADGDAPAP